MASSAFDFDDLAASLAWGHERVDLIHDSACGLHAIIAVHSTTLGPALGGMRFSRYPGGVAEALDDALRLSRAMTLKASAAGLSLGGGKAVVLDDGREDLRTARLVRLAEELEQLGGAYITAEDVGTTTADMDLLARHTSHVVGRSTTEGGAGDPSPDTARTVLAGIRAAVEVLFGSGELAGRSVAIAGLGKVGRPLASWLVAAGARVLAYDPRASEVAGVRLVRSMGDLLAAEVDVLAPCALGGLVDENVAAVLRCRVVCGAANNPLTGPDVGALLSERGVLYVPDFLANCGGLIHADAERRGAPSSDVEHGIAAAEARIRAVLAEAHATRRPPAELAERHAWRRIEKAAHTGAEMAAPLSPAISG